MGVISAMAMKARRRLLRDGQIVNSYYYEPSNMQTKDQHPNKQKHAVRRDTSAGAAGTCDTCERAASVPSGGTWKKTRQTKLAQVSNPEPDKDGNIEVVFG